jgi:predicted membrane protein
MKKTHARILRALGAFAIVTALTTPAIYWVAIAIWPPVTSDGHPVMPIGHVAAAIIVGPVAGLCAALFVGFVRSKAPE